MGITNFDLTNQRHLSRIASALERIADSLEKKTCSDDPNMGPSEPGDKQETK